MYTLRDIPRDQAIEVTELAQSWLNGRWRAVLEPLLDVVAKEADKENIAVTKTVIDGFQYESGKKEIIVIQSVDLPADLALSYWGRVANAVGDWKETLPDALRAIAFKHFSIEVSWNTDEESV